MKQLLSTTTLLLLTLIGFGQTTAIPDNNFEQRLIDLGYDDVLDGVVLTENINSLITIDVAGQEISDLTGIEDFEMLEGLFCSTNDLVTIDLSENSNLETLVLGYNNLTTLNLSENTNLKTLSCDNNNLTDIDLSGNTNLVKLYIVENAGITSLDLSSNTLVEEIYARDCDLTEIDLTGCINLRILDISSNDLPAIDFSTCVALADLICSENPLSDIDLSANTALIKVVAKDCGLADLNLDGLTVLSVLNCAINDLETLELSDNANLQELIINSNDIVELDLTVATNLLVFECYDNDIVELDLTALNELKVFNCGLNPLNTLDVTENDSLVSLAIRQLPEGAVVHLDLSDKPNLAALICMQNEGLVSVDLKNGNTESVVSIIGHSCPKFVCLQVEDEEYVIDNWFLNLDIQTEVSEFCGLNIENSILNLTSVYPIPATNQLNVETDQEMTYQLLSISGKVVKSGILTVGVNSITVSNFPKGIYFIQLSNDAEKTTHKVVFK
mgnify:CR=1 FL=1